MGWGGFILPAQGWCSADPWGEGCCCRVCVLVPPGLWLLPTKLRGKRGSLGLSPLLCPQLADVESSPSKEEDEDDDDTMQNTVVLFSNTDKFVLMQVSRTVQGGQMGQGTELHPLRSPHTSFLQDMCVVCGSFGRGAEGHLLACSQCSQCYHPYCVNSKVSRAGIGLGGSQGGLLLSPTAVAMAGGMQGVMPCWCAMPLWLCPLLTLLSSDHEGDAAEGLALRGVHRLRGVWQSLRPIPAAALRRLRHQLPHLLPGPTAADRAQRRMEVQMVLEGSLGKRWGEQREGCEGLVLNPLPLPPRCVCCVQCGAASPGFHCEWQNNYTHCAPCASLVVCPFCREKYVEDDLLIQCRHCDR